MSDPSLFDTSAVLLVTYKNYKGEVSQRRIQPCNLKKHWGATSWHPEQQWLVEAYDLDKEVFRIFALSGFIKWSVAPAKLPVD